MCCAQPHRVTLQPREESPRLDGLKGLGPETPRLVLAPIHLAPLVCPSLAVKKHPHHTTRILVCRAKAQAEARPFTMSSRTPRLRLQRQLTARMAAVQGAGLLNTHTLVDMKMQVPYVISSLVVD